MNYSPPTPCQQENFFNFWLANFLMKIVTKNLDANLLDILYFSFLYAGILD